LLLEFTALKYSLDEFDQYTFGSLIELETECLMKEKMSVHHSRWKESILAHNIVDICHRPGIENPVADGLSRKWELHKPQLQDGSKWSVLPDWEAAQGIKNDILLMTDGEPQQTQHPLEAHFKDDMFFQPIVQHLLGHKAGECYIRNLRRSSDQKPDRNSVRLYVLITVLINTYYITFYITHSYR
jgi:hypothetical protein